MRGLIHRRRDQYRKFPLYSIFLAALGVLPLLTCSPCLAWVGRSNAEMRSAGNGPTGLPVETLLEKPVGTLAREMLLQNHLDSAGTPGEEGQEEDGQATGNPKNAG